MLNLLCNQSVSALPKSRRNHWFITKLLRVMQLTAAILLICSLSLSAGTVSQTITFSGNDVSALKAFAAVEQQTALTITGNSSELLALSPVTIEAVNMDITTFMSLVLKGQPYAFEIRSKTIFIRRTQTTAKLLAIMDIPPITVRGRVVNEKGEPVVVSIVIEGTARGTITDASGNFFLEHVGESDLLIITATNIETLTVPVDGRKNITIRVIMTSTGLEEIIFNKGYYSEKQRLSTGSVSKVNAKEIERQPVTNLVGALAGRVAGLQVEQSGGIPGAGFKVRIRGQNSIAAGNNPLYVVDGVPFSSQTLSNSTVSQLMPSGQLGVSPLNTLNPADILSIEVLKDADATAIYGSRGANGVVLITTKKGVAGATTYNMNIMRGGSRVTKLVDLMNTQQYLTMRKEAFANDGISAYPADAFDINGTWDSTRYTDWQKELIGGTAELFTAQASVSGGSKNTQFLLRAGYHNEGTVFPGDFAYKRGSALFNINHRSEDGRFSVNITNNYAIDDNNFLSNDITRSSLVLAPNAPALYNDDGSLNWANSTWTNPLNEQEGKYTANTRNMNFNTAVGYRLLGQLEIKLNIGFNTMNMDDYVTAPSSEYDPAWEFGSQFSSAFANSSKRESWIVEPQASWKVLLGPGTLNILGGLSFHQEKFNQLVQFGAGFASNAQISDIASASYYGILANTTDLYKYNAVFARVNYNIGDKYMLNLTGRKDGSSRFGPGKQFAQFGAVGAAWIFSEEPFIQSSMPFLHFGKLRGSFGLTGNDQIGNYQFLDNYAPSSAVYQNIRGMQIQRLFNNNFAWETNKKFEAAIELGFLQQRIFVSAAFYRNRSSNQLVGIPLPAITGFTSIQANFDATVQNTGWELELRTINVDRKRIKWTSAFNISMPDNKLLRFPELEGSTYANKYVVGQPLSIIKMYRMTGIDPQAGTYTFEDVNKDGQITAPDDQQVISQQGSQYFGGLSNDLSIGRFQFDLFFQFVKQIKRSLFYYISLPGTLANQPVAILNRWPEQNATSQRYTTLYENASGQFDKAINSTVGVADASFIRMKNISISYQLVSKPKKLQCRVYMQGQNLLTITRSQVGDPESEMSYLPPLKTITAGIEFTF